jgi:hypothetical protein
MRKLWMLPLLVLLAWTAPEAEAQTRRANDAVLTTNPYLGTAISSYDARVSPYSPIGANNQYTTDGGKIYAQDGSYLGRLNANRYDPESVSNPYGQYGSRYSSKSINNPYSTYGSVYSTQSPNNPYSVTPPVVRYESTYKPPCYYNCKD